MKTYTFRTHIDPDVRHFPQFEFYVMTYLNDPDGWARHGYTFEPVSAKEDVLIRLASPSTIEKDCGVPNNLSCATMNGNLIYINADRWFHGSKQSKLKLDDYRQYLISHEMGHILGFHHKKCPCEGCLAPVMMQQTLGIGKCNPNTKVII